MFLVVFVVMCMHYCDWLGTSSSMYGSALLDWAKVERGAFFIPILGILWQPSASIGMQMAFLVAGRADMNTGGSRWRFFLGRLLLPLLMTAALYYVTIVWAFHINPRRRIDKRWWPAFQSNASNDDGDALMNILARTWSLTWFIGMLAIFRLLRFTCMLFRVPHQLLTVIAVGMYVTPRHYLTDPNGLSALSELVGLRLPTTTVAETVLGTSTRKPIWHINHLKLNRKHPICLMPENPFRTGPLPYGPLNLFCVNTFTTTDAFLLPYVLAPYIVGGVRMLPTCCTPRRTPLLALCGLLTAAWCIYAWKLVISQQEVAPALLPATMWDDKDFGTCLTTSLHGNRPKNAAACCRGLASDFKRGGPAPSAAWLVAKYHPNLAKLAVIIPVGLGMLASILFRHWLWWRRDTCSRSARVLALLHHPAIAWPMRALRKAVSRSGLVAPEEKRSLLTDASDHWTSGRHNSQEKMDADDGFGVNEPPPLPRMNAAADASGFDTMARNAAAFGPWETASSVAITLVSLAACSSPLFIEQDVLLKSAKAHEKAGEDAYIVLIRAATCTVKLSTMVAWAALMPSTTTFVSRAGSRTLLPYLLQHIVQVRPIVNNLRWLLVTWGSPTWPLVLPTLCYAAWVLTALLVFTVGIPLVLSLVGGLVTLMLRAARSFLGRLWQIRYRQPAETATTAPEYAALKGDDLTHSDPGSGASALASIRASVAPASFLRSASPGPFSVGFIVMLFSAYVVGWFAIPRYLSESHQVVASLVQGLPVSGVPASHPLAHNLSRLCGFHPHHAHHQNGTVDHHALRLPSSHKPLPNASGPQQQPKTVAAR